MKLLGLSSVATGGKDFCFNLLDSKYPGLFVRLALADKLKEEVNNHLKSLNQYKIDAFTQDPNLKAQIRPYLVEFAREKRQNTQGKYFVDLIKPSVKTIQEQGKIPCIVDIRYSEFQEDEVDWLLKNDGLLIHITRYDKDGLEVPPANDDEKINNPKVKAKSHFQIYWATTDDKNQLLKYLDFIDGFVKYDHNQS